LQAHILSKKASGGVMSLKRKITRALLRATSDKTELNQTILKWKKYFDEAGKAIGAGSKKKK
jgi:hypothetical protein